MAKSKSCLNYIFW